MQSHFVIVSAATENFCFSGPSPASIFTMVLGVMLLFTPL